MIGHLLGAAGAVEAIATAADINRGLIHPTINYENPDPACDLDYVPNQARRKEVRIAISNWFRLWRPHRSSRLEEVRGVIR